MLNAMTLYWVTNTGTSSSRSYWEGAQASGGPFNAFDAPALPVAVTIFPAEIYLAPRSWGEQSFGNLIPWNEIAKAATSPPGSSRNCSRTRSVRRSARCAS